MRDSRSRTLRGMKDLNFSSDNSGQVLRSYRPGEGELIREIGKPILRGDGRDLLVPARQVTISRTGK